MKLIALLLIPYCLGGATQAAVTIAVSYRARMRRQRFEALRARIVGNTYWSKLKVGGRFFDK